MKQWMKKINGVNAVILVFIIELLHFFFFRRDLGFIVSPVLFLASGCFYYFYLSKRAELFYLEPVKERSYKISASHWRALGILLFCIFIIVRSFIILRPIDVKDSDIIPLILNVYVDRFLDGEAVYAAYTGFNYGTFVPNYMPFQWLPFTLTRLLLIDPRFIHASIFMLAMLAMIVRSYHVSYTIKELMAKCLLPFVFLGLIFFKQEKDFSVTVELVIAAYYILLALCLFSTSKIFQIVGLGLSLLSRYSLLFWMPVWALCKWLYNKKEFLFIGIGLLIFGIIFYIIPFVIPNPEVLSKGSNLWIDASLNEWDGQDWQPKGDRPFQLFQGLGFASWFHQFYPGTLMDKLLACKNALIGCSILSTLFLMYARFKNSSLDQRIFLLLSFKFSITIFYSLVFIPYVYLYWVPLALSMVILVQLKLVQPES